MTDSPSDARKPKVLVVDDNEDILNIIQRVLGNQAYEIRTAVNGQQALDEARREVPDLMLLDVMLPEIDGLSVCRQLKADPATRSIMILLVTGRGSIGHRAEGLDAGADDYIPKPFHITELMARVRSALRIKRLNDDLREANRQLIASQRERLRTEKMATIGLLATGLAHEFNNIMSGILGYAQLARRSDKFKDQFVDVAIAQSERALELTRSLSTFYRPSPQTRPIHLDQVVESALCLVAKQVEERRITVVREFSAVPPVLGSAGQLQEVILNLVINALHAMESGGRIGANLRADGASVRLRIEDNGCGIPPANLDRIFDPFFTTKGALGGGNTTGSGLGLSVSYNIIRAHGGTIEVESEVGKGTAFIISLPAMEQGAAAKASVEGAAALAATPAQPSAASRAASGSGGRRGDEPCWGAVLVADGDKAVQEMVSQFLEAKEVVGVGQWPEALEKLQDRPFQFIVLDLDLPGIGGPRGVFDKIMELWPDSRVILTSRSFPDREGREIAARASGHLLKPYTMENLAGMMSRQLPGAKSQATS